METNTEMFIEHPIKAENNQRMFFDSGLEIFNDCSICKICGYVVLGCDAHVIKLVVIITVYKIKGLDDTARMFIERQFNIDAMEWPHTTWQH
jgi:hypothetical protein